MGIRFPIAKLSDYGEQGEALLDHPNPFALVTAAHLLTQRTRGDDVKRYALKTLLVQKLYERGRDAQLIVDLFNFIDWMMRLPEDLESKLLDEIVAYERKHNVAYINSFERRGLERGRQEGRQEGQAALLAKQLAKRFGTLPGSIAIRLASATPGELQAWGEAVLDAPTLDSVFAKH